MRARPSSLCRRFALLGLVLVGACAGDEPATTPPLPESPERFALVRVASGLASPVQVVGGADPGVLYVVEQAGTIRTLVGSGLAPEPLLDIQGDVTAGGEQGLLALALHPSFPEDPRFYVHYSNRDGDTRVVEFRAGDAGAERVRELLAVDQPYENHNGGQLAFGPDGLLYLGLGDGGGAFDPEGRSQDLGTPLGKLLRLDVDRADEDWEVVANGLRNPWRFSFDRETGDLYIGDVGQDRWEEVNVVPAGTDGFLNFGWDVYEGDEQVEDKELTGDGELVRPIASYAHDAGCSITGGFVYRGSAFPDLRGRYFYGDYCSGTIWSLRVERGDATDVRRERVTVPQLTSFGQDAAGELYLVSQAGWVYRLAAG
jgi:glucose/arabinose dehydrogenase